MMNYRLQKTILSKYLNLVERDSVSEKEMSDFIRDIKVLYENKRLNNGDVFRQKIEMVISYLEKDVTKVKRKRSNKEIKLTASKEFCDLLEDDIEGVNFSNSDLFEIDNNEASSQLEISSTNVRAVLENLVLPKRKLSYEKDVEKFLSTQLSMIFNKENVHVQYNVGGFLGLKTDVDIGNGQVGIEIKIVDKLTATEMQRMIGQVVYYAKRFYDKNLLVFLASRKPIDAKTTELIEFIEEFGVDVVFNKAIKE